MSDWVIYEVCVSHITNGCNHLRPSTGQKTGKTIVIDILTFYRVEMSSASFAKQLKNNLDKTLMKNISSIENGQELNIEDSVNLVFNEVTKYLQK